MATGEWKRRSEEPLGGKLQAVSLTSVPGEFAEQILREEMLRRVPDQPSSPSCPPGSGAKDTEQRAIGGGRDGIQRVGLGQVAGACPREQHELRHGQGHSAAPESGQCKGEHRAGEELSASLWAWASRTKHTFPMDASWTPRGYPLDAP